jgi:hypothetical protein
MSDVFSSTGYLDNKVALLQIAIQKQRFGIKASVIWQYRSCFRQAMAEEAAKQESTEMAAILPQFPSVFQREIERKHSLERVLYPMKSTYRDTFSEIQKAL